jgi:hypothetical protein
MAFLGFGVEAEYEGMMGWANGETLFWIAAADGEGKTHKYRKGDIGFHHYAFRLRSRKDVDALQAFLESQGVRIVDPAGEYYDDYYATFFLDPDGMKLEGMKYGDAMNKPRRNAPPASVPRRSRSALGGRRSERRRISMMSAVDQPICMMPFSAVMGLSSRHWSAGMIAVAERRVVAEGEMSGRCRAAPRQRARR